jgi:hypothetical protein
LNPESESEEILSDNSSNVEELIDSDEDEEEFEMKEYLDSKVENAQDELAANGSYFICFDIE